MDRRRFLLLALAGALASPPISEGQRAGKVYRIGFISNGGHRTHDPLRAAFLDGLRELGWLEATTSPWRFAGPKAICDAIPS